mgnify:FL=1
MHSLPRGRSRRSLTGALWRLILLVALTWVAAGCVKTPVAEVHSVRVQSASPQGLGLTMVMRVNNLNDFDVKVRNINAGVVVANRYQLPPLQHNPDTWLGAHRWTFVQVPVLIPWNLVTPRLAATAGASVVPYRVKGVVDVTAVRMLGIAVNNYEFDEKASMSRIDLVMAAGRGVFTP